jgi:ABC-type lipoprotein export system ATPase subunit
MAIMGASGSGKTTLLQILAGQRIQMSGEVRLRACLQYTLGHAISEARKECVCVSEGTHLLHMVRYAWTSQWREDELKKRYSGRWLNEEFQ